jgi:hypothetical protein
MFTILYLDSTLPRAPSDQRIYAITEKKGPKIFGTRGEFQIYQAANYLVIGAIVLGFVSGAVAMRLAPKEEKRPNQRQSQRPRAAVAHLKR